jgi:Protein of unknown function (DUF2800)
MAEPRIIPPSKHADGYGASSAHRWRACPGSLILAKDAPKPVPSKPAAEGTVAHFIAAEAFVAGKPASDYVGQRFTADGFEFTVDQDMADNIQVYLDNLREYQGDDGVDIEVEVDYSATLGVKPREGWGTSDAIITRADEISVHDLKFGRGESVDAEDNVQMQLYALGALEKYGDILGYDDSTKVVMVIHQPRVQRAPREWSCTVGELREFGAETKRAVHLSKAAIWAYAGWKNDGRLATGWAEFEREYLRPGEKQCRWCPVAGCSARAKAATRVVFNAAPVTPDEFDQLPAPVDPKAHATDAQWLAAALRVAPMIEDWLKALYVARDQRMQAGEHIPGFKLVLGQQGDRAWTDTTAVEHYLKTGIRLKDDLVYTKKLIGPAGAEKLTKGAEPAIGKKQWETLQGMIKRAPGKPTVVPESDGRPAIVVTPIEDEFDDLTKQIADDIG